MDKVVILGAGIGGLSTAVALRRVGIAAEVWEQAPQLRAAGTALSVGCNAAQALRLLDIDLGFDTARGANVSEVLVLTPTGKTLVDLPIAELGQRLGAPTTVIHRGDLQAGLLEQAEDIPIHLGAAATGYSTDASGVRVRFADGREATGTVLIGADGINSVVRSQLHGPHPTRYGGFLCWLATTDQLDHPVLRPGRTAQYWGRGKRFGMHDIGDGHSRTYWWGTMNMSERAASEWDGDKADIAGAFAGWAPETAKAIEVTPAENIVAVPAKDIVAVPAKDRPFVDCWGDGPVTLLGDAAHPMLTSLAQGGSSAIEDAVVLAAALQAADDPVSGLRRYEDLRRERTRKLVETSYQLHRLEQQETAPKVLLRDIGLRLFGRAKMMEIFTDAMTMPQLPFSPTVTASVGESL